MLFRSLLFKDPSSQFSLSTARTVSHPLLCFRAVTVLQNEFALITSFVIAFVLHLAGVQILCVIGICVGIAMFLCGLRLRHSSSAAVSTQQEQIRTRLPGENTSVQAIRRSSKLNPAKSVHMTQQQKITAALALAGKSSPKPSTESSLQVALAKGEVSAVPTDSPVEIIETEKTDCGLKHKLLISIGLAITLASLLLFLTLR